MGIRLAVFGGSGLTGFEFIKLAIHSKDIEVVYSFGRSALEMNSEKLIQKPLDYYLTSESLSIPEVDVVVCCLGTTIKKAGSQEAFKSIDVDLPISIAEFARLKGVKKFIIQSSLGAGGRSGSFYLKCKTEAENRISALDFESTIILRPSLLLGNRKEFRLGERISSVLLKVISPLLIGRARKYRGIEALDVAKTILHFSILKTSGIIIIESDEIQKFADSQF